MPPLARGAAERLGDTLTDQATRDYIARRQAEGKTKSEAIAAASATSPAISSTHYRKQRSVDSRSITYPVSATAAR